MDIHKPKPWHGVREFLKEYVIIVVGVLTALAGEQAIETLHWRHKVDEAEQAMRIELTLDDGPQAYARVAASRCLDGQLQAIIQAVEAGRDRSEVASLTEAYQPPLRTWDRQAWDSAVASDIGNHVGATRLDNWGRVYNLMPLLNAQTARETEGIDLLTSGSAAKGPLHSEQADRTLRAAKSLRRSNSDFSAVSQQMLHWLTTINAPPTQRKQAEILADARRRFGACVLVPNPSSAYRNSGEYSSNRELAVPK